MAHLESELVILGWSDEEHIRVDASLSWWRSSEYMQAVALVGRGRSSLEIRRARELV